jgi:glutamyl-tRNA synthetase
MPVVTRIAPSPTGDPHVGTAYVGLFNYAFARRHGGRFVLRLEDTDRQRYQAEAEERILAMFDWLGLRPDEGPGIGGEHGPYRQSERLALYQEHAQRLIDAGHAYRAFETPEELDAMRLEQRRLGQDPGYDGRGRAVSRRRSRRARRGRRAARRAAAHARRGRHGLHDLLRGEVRIPNAEIRDTVLLKSDGFPTYHLAVVVDDHLMGVTHVMRAEEWVTSTPIHVLLYRAFGWELPTFVHLPLLRNPDANKTKISKRKMDTSVESYREQGILPEALLNFLGTMGWSMPDGRELFSLDEMVAAFDPARISLGGPVFDLKRLRSLNARYLRDVLSIEALAERAAALAARARHRRRRRGLPPRRPRRAAAAGRDAARAADQLVPFFETRCATTSTPAGAWRRARATSRTSSAPSRARVVRRRRRRRAAARLRAAPGGADGQGDDAAAGRADGDDQAPGVVDLVVIMGKERVLERIGQALQAISEGLPDDDPERLKAEAEAAAKEASAAKRGRRPVSAAERG